MKLGSSGAQVADVDHLVLTRDAGQLTLEQRNAVPARAQSAAARWGRCFRAGAGSRSRRRSPVEQAELQRFAGSPTLDDTFTEAILIFADSTADQLRALAFRPVGGTGRPSRTTSTTCSTRSRETRRARSRSDIIGPLLNGEATGFFLARLERTNGGPVLFEIDPDGRRGRAAVPARVAGRRVGRQLGGRHAVSSAAAPPGHGEVVGESPAAERAELPDGRSPHADLRGRPRLCRKRRPWR